MASRFFIAALLTALIAGHAHGEERWEKAADVSAVAIEIKHVSATELAQLQRKYSDLGGDLRRVNNRHREGLAILYTNKETGARRCEIYTALVRPSARELADALAHEAAHCFGFIHE